MDAIGWFIANTHQVLGHEKAAAVMGVMSGDKNACKLCKYEKTYAEEDRLAVLEAVLEALKPTAEWEVHIRRD